VTDYRPSLGRTPDPIAIIERILVHLAGTMLRQVAAEA